MDTAEIPEIGVSTWARGFDTTHIDDTNIGPNGETGQLCFEPTKLTKEIVWTKEKVFKHLREVADEIILRSNFDDLPGFSA